MGLYSQFPGSEAIGNRESAAALIVRRARRFCKGIPTSTANLSDAARAAHFFSSHPIRTPSTTGFRSGFSSTALLSFSSASWRFPRSPSDKPQLM